MNRKMKCLSRKLIAATFVSTLAAAAQAQSTLVNGKKITLPPVGHISQPLASPIIYRGRIPIIGSHAANLVASPNGKFAIATDLGFRQYLSVISTTTGDVVSQVGYGAPYISGRNGLFFGLVFAPTVDANGNYTLFAAQGNNNTIAVLKLNPTTGALAQALDAGSKPVVINSATTYDFPAGLAISADGRYLYAANHQAKTSNNAGSLSIFDLSLAVSAQVGRYDFSGVSSAVATPAFGTTAAGTASNFPYAIAVKGNTVYVTGSADSHVYAIDVTTAATPALLKEIFMGSGLPERASDPNGAHPIGLLVSGNNLYVANAHTDTISIVNTTTNAKLLDIDLRPQGAKSLVGVTPNQMAISPDGRTLYAALSDMQAVAVIDTASNKIKGEIPVGWYPSAIVATSDGQRILVANARGTQTRYPNPGQKTNTSVIVNEANYSQYNLNMIEANVETIQVPSAPQLQKYTLQVLANNRITANTDNPTFNPLYNISKANGGIKHVFYIIRENRTYDQVLGDLNTAAFGSKGNGDSTLTLFGNDVTPNIHALAQNYVLLDNFFDIGDASMEGWDWTTSALNNEHNVRNQPYNYSGRGANYDSEGTVNNYPVGGFPAGAAGYSFPNFKGTPVDAVSSLLPTLPAIPDAGIHPNGRIYDTIAAAGNTVRNYGCLVAIGYPAVTGLQPGAHYDAGMGKFDMTKFGKTDLDFAGYDNRYAESPAPYDPAVTAAATNAGYLPPHHAYGKYGSTNRFAEWKREFDAMIANDATGSSVPNFEMVRFGRDHTQGINAGGPSAKAEVADNDYAVGKFVEAISNSPIWSSSAIFVIEDDSQDGPDHVDGHRSIGFVISPYIRKGTINSKFYNTTSFLHNIEMLLNAQPMTHYDAIADYIDAWDTAPNNNAAYTAVLPSPTILSEVLPSGFLYAKATPKEKSEFRRLTALAAKMDLEHADAADPALLNEMIWKSD